MPPSTVVTTARLAVRRFTLDDAPFVVQLLNDAAFLEFIGDKNVRTLDDARTYITTVPLASYAKYGFGHYLVELKADARPIGICSLVKRDWLDDVDLGFAFLPDYRRSGYAFEASSAVAAYAHATLGMSRLVAITSPGNAASISLLGKLGFVSEGATRNAQGEELLLFADRPAAAGPSSHGA
jgi:RimJ/RimL family protein N-acetyltransferase